jgi:hypothetical protein
MHLACRVTGIGCVGRVARYLGFALAMISMRRDLRGAAIATVSAFVLLMVLPGDAWAWTPGTHVYLGDLLLRNLALIPPSLALLLRRHADDFLYGSIAADTSIAKKYADVGRHCHHWPIGLEIHDRADTDALRAFALGYLAHLAADTVAHNYFVPRQLAITSTTSALGHSYWESRFETHLGEQYARRARELLYRDHAAADGHLDRILSPTLFSTATNRRIFRGMVMVTDSESWQRIFSLVGEHSRFDLPDADVQRYLARSFDYVVDFLRRWEQSEPATLDPSGEGPLSAAKKLRRAELRRGGSVRAAIEAERQFGMPESTLAYAAGLPGGMVLRTELLTGVRA